MPKQYGIYNKIGLPESARQSSPAKAADLLLMLQASNALKTRGIVHARPSPVLRRVEPHSVAFNPPIVTSHAPAKTLHVVMVTPELAPVAKVGGVADVVFGLSAELEKKKHCVEIILPKYDTLRYDQIHDLHVCWQDLWVPWYDGRVHASVWLGEVHGRKCYFIEPHSQDNFFNRSSFYGQPDDVERFAFFCCAAMEFLLQSGKQPDIIHCHDWQAALVPVLFHEIHRHMGMTHPRICCTIHNFKHQGLASPRLLEATGLDRPDYFLSPERLGDSSSRGMLNLMKGGIVYADFVNTVSPHYAWESRYCGHGFGLEETLHAHHSKYGGILNGVDENYWNPQNDRHIPQPYSARNIDAKYKNKAALRQRLSLADGAKPIIGWIGRLDPHKGLDLLRHALDYALSHEAQFVMLGTSAEPKIQAEFSELKRRLGNNRDCCIELSFNEELAHLIYAGADMMLVPSRHEPCGLVQLIAMRYGTVPIVRMVGGLADTVFDKDYSEKTPQERNGYGFNDDTVIGLERCLQRAIACYYTFPADFRNLMLNGMRTDCSWKQPAQQYVDVYELIREKE